LPAEERVAIPGLRLAAQARDQIANLEDTADCKGNWIRASGRAGREVHDHERTQRLQQNVRRAWKRKLGELT